MPHAISCARRAAVPCRRTGAIADQAYINDSIYTVDDDLTWAEAIAITDGRISAVGSTAEIMSRVEPGADVVDLAGRFMMPGFIDAHVHFMWGQNTSARWAFATPAPWPKWCSA